MTVGGVGVHIVTSWTGYTPVNIVNKYRTFQFRTFKTETRNNTYQKATDKKIYRYIKKLGRIFNEKGGTVNQVLLENGF